MNRSAKDFVAIVELAEGNHEYKFNVDGEWINDPNSPVVETSQGESINDITFFNIWLKWNRYPETSFYDVTLFLALVNRRLIDFLPIWNIDINVKITLATFVCQKFANNFDLLY